MVYGIGKDTISRWREAECKVLTEICTRHGISLKEALRKAENELGSLKAKYQKVLDFIEGLKLTQKLQEFLKPRARGVKRRRNREEICKNKNRP